MFGGKSRNRKEDFSINHLRILLRILINKRRKERCPTGRQKLKDFTRALSNAGLGLYATSGAYYLFLSLWPLAMLSFSLLPYTSISQQQFLNALLGYTPEPFQRLMAMIAADIYDSSATAVGFGIITELWSAGKFLSSLITGIDHIYDGGGSHRSGSLRRRLLGAGYTGLLVLLIVGNLGLLFFGHRLLEAAVLRRPTLSRMFSLLSRLRCPLFFAGVTSLALLLFRTLPQRKLPLRRLLPGAAGGAVSWLLFSRLYTWAIERFQLFSVYGSLTFVIISLFWMYISLYILFFSAWLNVYLSSTLSGVKTSSNNTAKKEHFHL